MKRNRRIFLSISKTGCTIAAAALTVALTGCRVKELGAHISPTQAASVDSTWVKAAKACWPQLTEKSDTYVSVNLADPIGFRSTFPAYAALTDEQIEKLVPSPLNLAPPADISLFSAPTSPLLTRRQALDPDSAAADASTGHPDTLCAVHNATPAGYR